jgi:hypothetical protein
MRNANTLASAIIVAVLGSEATALPLGYDWHHYGGQYYALSQTYGNWLEVEAEAESLSGYLVAINDAPETAWLNSVFSGLPLFIGLRQFNGSPEPKGGWEWASGEPLVYTNWDFNQPDNWTGHDNYGMINPTGGGYVLNKWHDVPVEGWQPTANYRGIIEIPEPATLTLLTLGGLALTRRKRRQVGRNFVE